MKRVSFSPLLTALAAFLFLLFLPNQWLTSLITHHTVEKSAFDLDPDMFQGMQIQKKMLQDSSFLPIYGSSELSRMDPFHPSNYFHENDPTTIPFLVGRGGTQSLVHFLNFSATKSELKNKKIVFILSPQWFTPKGIDDVHFEPNFSTQQAYDFALHSTLSPSLQEKGAKRLLQFDFVKKDKVLTILLNNQANPKGDYQQKAKAVTPLAHLFLNVLTKRDLLLSLFNINMRHLHTSKTLTKDVSWETLNANASAYGKKHTTTNPFGIEDRYYNFRIKDFVPKLKGYRKGQSFASSPEYNDFKLTLDVLKEAGAKPLFISVPVNGKWYDYAGFPKKGRTDYYQKINKEIKQEGFPIVDLSSHEYDPYFIKDTMHLGWKGWAYIDRSLVLFTQKR